jgi:hypothetical protein
MKRYFNGEPLDLPPSSPRDDLDSIDEIGSEITGGSAHQRARSPPNVGYLANRPVAPMLNLQEVGANKIESDRFGPSEEFKGQNEPQTFAAGAALNHIRKVKSGSVHSKS